VAPQFKEAMEREGKKGEIKGWLLALALATILTWYVINPVPRPRPQTRLKDDSPEADRHQEGIRLGESSRRFEMRPGRMPTAWPSLIADEALPEWPEYLDLD
jgi:hypothetical protein